MFVGQTAANETLDVSMGGETGEVGDVGTNSDASDTETNEDFLAFLVFTIFIPMLIRLARLLFLFPTSVISVLSDIEDLLLLTDVLNFLVFPPITDRFKREAFRLILFRVDGLMAKTRNIAIGWK